MQTTSRNSSSSAPTISVGMPVYNGEEFVGQSIQSILDQSFADFELIISDNGSSDNSEEICRAYADGDSRIRYYRNAQNMGAAKNYNRLFELARGEYFRWSNADDLIGQNHHEICLNALLENPGAVLSYGKTALIDEVGETTALYEDNLHLPQEKASERFVAFFERAGFTTAIYGLMRKEALAKTRLFGDGTLPAADTFFMAELTLRGGFFEVPTVSFYRRMHSKASSADRSDDARQKKFWRAESTPTPFKLPILRQSICYLQSIWKSGIGFAEKCRLSMYILRRAMWQRSEIFSEIFALPR